MAIKILGLDLGVASIGWGVIEAERDEKKLKNVSVLALGVREIPLDAKKEKEKFSSGDAVTINHIRSEIEKLQELGKFSEPVQKIQVAVLIHHITKRSMKTISEYSEIDEDTLRKYSRIYTEILK